MVSKFMHSSGLQINMSSQDLREIIIYKTIKGIVRAESCKCDIHLVSRIL